MSEKQFVKGFSIKSIQTKYGELLKGAINLEQIGENPKNEKGWVNKTGSKWLTMPIQMLQYRAFAFFARIHCPEKLLGLNDEFEHEDIKPARSIKAENLTKALLDIEPAISPTADVAGA